MRIKEEFKKSGYFWLPSDPERKIPGTLVITDGGNIELEVIGLFDESIEGLNRVGNGKPELERIIGHIEKHGLVTLDDCFYKNTTVFLGAISKSPVHVKKALIGNAYDDKAIVLFNTFQFSVEGIDEWIGLSGINVERQYEKRTASITYSPLEDISLNLNNGMKLLITFKEALPGSPITTEAKITQKTYFKLVSEQERPPSDFISAAYNITRLLGFAIDKTVCIEQVSATSNAIRQDVNNGKTVPVSISLYYASLPYTKIEPKIDRNGMLFKFEQIREDAERIVNNWFDAYNEIDPALNLYFSAKTGAHEYLESKFLALAQGLETFHRRTSNEKLMNEAFFNELSENLIKQCPEENQKWLSERLKYGNQVGLCRRIKSIIEPFKKFLGNSNQRDELIGSIVDTRNYLTHYDKSLESKAATSGRDLYFLCLKMEAIFQLQLLQVLGFTQAEVKSVFDNSHELQQKLNCRRSA
ncbi:MAG: hypothetical protein PHC94_02810 [Methylobacter sp.]|nr:hypothetical protein [Methylobacter sp.]